MNELSTAVTELAKAHGPAVIRGAIVALVGYLLIRAARRGLIRALSSTLPAHQSNLIARFAGYAMSIGLVVWLLKILGFDPSVLLGAAGIVTVALGFASQTSVSNVISGVFLISEQPFKVGDVITADGVTGEVLEIGLLSTRLRTFDNLYVRIPNESMLKSRVTTLTRFPIRRLDLIVNVAYRENLERVRSVLLEVAEDNPICLDDPKPTIIFQRFAESGVELQLSGWAARESFLDLRNTLSLDVKAAFDREGIEIPFPHLSLYAGSESGPLEMRTSAPD